MARLDRLEAENAALKKEIAHARQSQMSAGKLIANQNQKYNSNFRSGTGAPVVYAEPAPIQRSAPVDFARTQARAFSGAYAGINGGYGRGYVSSTTSSERYSSSDSGYDYRSDGFFAEGPVVGAQIGYNYQFANNVMLGIESDFDWADVIDSAAGYNSTSANNAYRQSSTYSYNSYNIYKRTGMDWLGTARLRIGYSLGSFFPYITGGLAYGQLSSENSNFTALSIPLTTSSIGYLSRAYGAASSVTAGWAIGAGGEYMLSGPWSVKAEYLYSSLGGVARYDTTINNGALSTISYPYERYAVGSFGIHQVRVGLNYHITFGDY